MIDKIFVIGLENPITSDRKLKKRPPTPLLSYLVL